MMYYDLIWLCYQSTRSFYNFNDRYVLSSGQYSISQLWIACTPSYPSLPPITSTHSTTKLCFCLGEELPSSVKCVDKEREALLTFKQDLVNASHRLSSWIGHDCCRWKGISCNNRIDHVTKVDLRNTYSIDAQVWDELAYDQSFVGGKLNPSLLDLKYLDYLDLSLNNP